MRQQDVIIKQLAQKITNFSNLLSPIWSLGLKKRLKKPANRWGLKSGRLYENYGENYVLHSVMN